MQNIKRGEIYWVNMDPAIGSEIKKLRPALIVSNDVSNQHSPLITILPITFNTKNPYPFEVLVKEEFSGLKKDSLIKANQIRTIDKLRISGSATGRIPDNVIMQKVDQAIKIHLALN
jgi:mRNA interferase MazF